MIPIERPGGFIRLSLSVAMAVTACLWVHYELSPLMPSYSSFPPLLLVSTAVRLVLVLALCASGAGVGMGCVSISAKCFRSPSRIKSPRQWTRYVVSFLSALAVAIALLATFWCAFACINAAGARSTLILFSGLEFSEYLLWRQYLHQRRVNETPTP